MPQLLADIKRQTREETREEIRKEIAERMIRDGFDTELVSEVTELDPEAVAELQRKLN